MQADLIQTERIQIDAVKRDAAPPEAVQVVWAATPIKERLQVIAGARHRMAGMADVFAAATSPEMARTAADTMAAELMPLLDACRFLEREAVRILAVRRLGRRGLPLWLAGVDSEVRRVPLGRVLVIGPANYPLFLPGVQALQGLVAGNAVAWKPGRGGAAVANLFAQAMAAAGLPPGLLRVTAESVEAGQAEIALGADKVFFTGSVESGRAVLRQLAETPTPSVMELSGCDAVLVLPSADSDRAVKALVFGMRLNGSATCMAPRRVIVVGPERHLEAKLIDALSGIDAVSGWNGVRIGEATRGRLKELIHEAAVQGARITGEVGSDLQRPVVLGGVESGMRIASADLFAPILMVMRAKSVEEALDIEDACPLALTVSIFGDESEARALAGRIRAGTVLINDVIVPTADPRVPFGGRRASGWGVTRGREGLLEMTAVKVISVRRGAGTRHYEATTSLHEGLFRGAIGAIHSRAWRQRWRAVTQMVDAARRLKRRS